MTTDTTTYEDVVKGFDLAVNKVESFHIPFLNKPLFTDKSMNIYRQEATVIGLLGLVFTGIFGYEFTVHNLFGFAIPSTGIHWTTVTLMTLQFAIVSLLIEKKGIVKLRNFIYSFVLAWGFSNVTFEWIYVPLYEAIHLKAFYITLPFLYDRPLGAYWVLFRNSIWLVLGLVFLSVILKSANLQLKPNKYWVIFGSMTAIFWIAWVFYPLPFQIVQGTLFPQTLYMIPEAIVNPLGDYQALFVSNFGVHTMNLLTKVFQFVTVGAVFTSLKLNNLLR